MKAAVCHEFGQPFCIEDVTLAAPGQGEIEVTLAACAICHSDIHYAEGAWGGDLPAVYGHEAAGRVTRVGDGVRRVKLGDPVVVTLIRSCGQCHYCAQATPVACDATFHLDAETPLASSDGHPLVHGLRTGAFAEKVVVEESQAVAVPQDMPMDAAALLACGVITGYGAVANTAAMRPGATVAVIGCGGVGLNSVQGAALNGASVVVGIDMVEEKLDAAQRFGATHAFRAADTDLAGKVRAVTGGRGADYVFVTVGAKAAIDQACALLAKGGAVVLVGMPESGVSAEYDPGSLAAHGQRILGSKMGSARIQVDIPYLVELYRQGRLKLDELISGRYPLERINEAIADVKAGRALRNVIVFE